MKLLQIMNGTGKVIFVMENLVNEIKQLLFLAHGLRV